MRIAQLTPGAGGMYCGNCLRDNALVAALRRQGHSVAMLPLYLPLKTDEPDESGGAPVFFSGINVYLEQKSPWFSRLPRWLHRALASPGLLRRIGTLAAKTRPEQVGDLTLSMLRGEQGRQAREIDELVQWLAQHERPEVVSLSNALLVGCARKIKQELGCVVAVTLQGEDSFLDALPPADRGPAWEIVAERLAEVDVLVSPSRYYADRMAGRLGMPPERIRVVPNGISRTGWRPAEHPPQPPVLGYFARMCAEKGLDLLVDAYIRIRRAGRVPGLKLKIGGGLGPGDQDFVTEQRRRLRAEGLLGETEFHPNVDHAAKQEFMRGLTVFSVPAHYGEAFGLYLLEAMASGVPVVQPRTAAFPEIIEQSGAGLISEAGDPQSLADRIEELLLDPARAAAHAQAGVRAVAERYNNEACAREITALYEAALRPAAPAAATP